jgi:hypothetical protein
MRCIVLVHETAASDCSVEQNQLDCHVLKLLSCLHKNLWIPLFLRISLIMPFVNILLNQLWLIERVWSIRGVVQVETESLGEKPFPVSLCPPQIQNELASYRTKFSHGEWSSTVHMRLVAACVCSLGVWEYISIIEAGFSTTIIITMQIILQWLEEIFTSNTDRVNPSHEA